MAIDGSSIQLILKELNQLAVLIPKQNWDQGPSGDMAHEEFHFVTHRPRGFCHLPCWTASGHLITQMNYQQTFWREALQISKKIQSTSFSH